MKTIKITFSSRHAEKVGIILHSLELKVLTTWCEESLLNDTNIFCVLKLNKEGASIAPELQLEKLRENLFIKLY
jgi:hypothetical protein